MLSAYKYCVVIPHRNVPELLEKCLRSVPKKSYILVLVVDNSDKDKNAQSVIDGFSCGFGGITLIEREPRGIGYIRNEALGYLQEHHFSGKLVFADADDFFTSEAAGCFEQFKDTDFDVDWFDVRGEDEQGKSTSNADYVSRNLQIYKEKKDLGALRYSTGPVWGKFISMDLVTRNNLWFQEIESCEDTLFSAQIGYYVQKPFVCVTPLYVYVQREGSLVSTMDAKKAKMGYQAAYDTSRWLKERTREGYYWTQYNVIWHWMNWCQQSPMAWKEFPRVLGLCDKRSALRGAMKVVKRKMKAKWSKT